MEDRYRELQAAAKEAGREVRVVLATPETFRDESSFVILAEDPLDLPTAIETLETLLASPLFQTIKRWETENEEILAEGDRMAAQRDAILARAGALVDEAVKIEEELTRKLEIIKLNKKGIRGLSRSATRKKVERPVEEEQS